MDLSLVLMNIRTFEIEVIPEIEDMSFRVCKQKSQENILIGKYNTFMQNKKYIVFQLYNLNLQCIYEYSEAMTGGIP